MPGAEHRAGMVLECCGEDGLDRMHPVLGLVKDDGLRAFKDLVRDLQRIEMELQMSTTRKQFL